MQAQNLYFLPSGTKEEFNVVIEIPYGSQNKYELDPETGALMLDRVLFSSDFYPFNYGFVPSTKSEDGDALDVAVFLTNPVPPCTVIKCRAVGMLKKIDAGDIDTCILAVPIKDPRFADIKDLNDIQAHKLEEIKDFFATYKRLQKKNVEIVGYFGAEQATQEVAKYLNNYPSFTK
jgi:inorganic pyrophosphatase